MEFFTTPNTLKNMYRYLNKYIGTYRVKAYFCETEGDFPRLADGTIDPSFEDLYIKCNRGGLLIKHTYLGDDILVICGYEKHSLINNVYEELKSKYKNLDIKLEINGLDGYIYFYGKDIKKIATIVKPQTSGANINPFSNKNLPKVEYKIPSSDLTELYELTKNLSRVETMHFYKKINSEFLDSIKRHNGVKFEGKKMQKASRLSSKEFIHSIGLWDKYISYIKKHL